MTVHAKSAFGRILGYEMSFRFANARTKSSRARICHGAEADALVHASDVMTYAADGAGTRRLQRPGRRGQRRAGRRRDVVHKGDARAAERTRLRDAGAAETLGARGADERGLRAGGAHRRSGIRSGSAVRCATTAASSRAWS